MNYIDLYQRLFYATKQAGIVAEMLQKGIQNMGKEVEGEIGESAHHKEMIEAKTKADEIVQEMLLQALLPMYSDVLTLDVEEDTHSIPLFTKRDYAYTLVMDPIDGTLSYCNQEDSYSICSAILHQGDVKLVVVYFPQRREIYGYVEGIGCMFYENPKACEWENFQVLSFQPKQIVPVEIYKNHRVPTSVVRQLQQRGFVVIDDQEHNLGCPDAILRCMRGEAVAYFSSNRNIRDILLGAILTKMEDGHSFSFEGQKVQWAQQGRQAEIVFSMYAYEDIF